MGAETVHSKCCSFPVSFLEDAEAYCYVCGEVHLHQHLDLRHFKDTLLGRVVARHAINWDEIAKDAIKFSGMEKGVFCQSLLTELEALCPHGNPIFYEDAPLRLHMCFGSDGTNGSDLSVVQGLDFTSDLCSKAVAQEQHTLTGPTHLSADVEQLAGQFRIGDVLRYNPDKIAFEHTC